MSQLPALGVSGTWADLGRKEYALFPFRKDVSEEIGLLSRLKRADALPLSDILPGPEPQKGSHRSPALLLIWGMRKRNLVNNDRRLQRQRLGDTDAKRL